MFKKPSEAFKVTPKDATYPKGAKIDVKRPLALIYTYALMYEVFVVYPVAP
jgi:hypothetical protein